MSAIEQAGLFGAVVASDGDYSVRFEFSDGGSVTRQDPYRFLPVPGELDLHLIGEGTHRRLWEVLGANVRTIDGVCGTSFAVWAPAATRVSVIGEFCRWDGRRFPMRSLGASGVWELFVPDISSGTHYRYELRDASGGIHLKADPFGRYMDQPPETCSRVFESSHAWEDSEWMAARLDRDPRRSPMSIYEVHLGSWKRVPEEADRSLSYREMAPQLAEHCGDLGFDWIELMPVAEHPFYGSWGYQVSGYFAPTSRYGDPDDFRWFVDYLHQHGIGVIVDWVPAHFPKDAFALARFDGTALYEHGDPRQGEHPDWGTYIFNYGRREVRNFLISNALFWMRELHIDALRVDAVASMLYLDYSRKSGEWIPNQHGGRENLEAVAFLRDFNQTVLEEVPGGFTIAEESTAWPGVTTPVDQGGLGFTLKWNMGWMHDTLNYLARDPIHRRYHQSSLSFSMIYEYDERFINPLSHDEVVHGKGSLLSRMPGDRWQQMANLRALFAYQWLRPGKKLVFMSSEFAPDAEWAHDRSVDWHQCDDPARQGLIKLITDLNRTYHDHPCLWERDPDPEGFLWIHETDADHSIFAWARCGYSGHLITIMNLTPQPHPEYRIGSLVAGKHRVILNSDAPIYGGSGYVVPSEVTAHAAPLHGREHSLSIPLPPLSVLVLAPSEIGV